MQQSAAFFNFMGLEIGNSGNSTTAARTAALPISAHKVEKPTTEHVIRDG